MQGDDLIGADVGGFLLFLRLKPQGFGFWLGGPRRFGLPRVGFAGGRRGFRAFPGFCGCGGGALGSWRCGATIVFCVCRAFRGFGANALAGGHRHGAYIEIGLAPSLRREGGTADFRLPIRFPLSLPRLLLGRGRGRGNRHHIGEHGHVLFGINTGGGGNAVNHSARGGTGAAILLARGSRPRATIGQLIEFVFFRLFKLHRLGNAFVDGKPDLPLSAAKNDKNGAQQREQDQEREDKYQEFTQVRHQISTTWCQHSTELFLNH